MKDNLRTPEPIAIVGLGGLFPKAGDIPAFWKNILGKVDCITEVPADRWDWHLYYSADRSAPDKTYSKIGGFVTDFKFDPLPLRIPPGVAKQMDTVQQFAVAATAEALRDSGYDKKPFDSARTAVIFGNAMGGVKKEATDLRVYTAEVRRRLLEAKNLSKLDAKTREAVADEIEASIKAGLSPITEDTMPGELSNVIAGRVANVFNLNGPNFTVDAACAASLAAIAQAVNGLRLKEFDMVVTGGIDQMMAPPAFVKFSKIGALSADGSRPFDAGANGFVMGEGAGVLILKRLTDAVKDGDKVYALIRSIGAAADGKGKGITAPNPKGQKLAMERAFSALDYGPESVGLLEAHGTSTSVGDLVEVQSAAEIFKDAAPRSVGLSSVKSQIGHLKAAAGVAGLVKAALSLHHKTLPPTINFKTPNPGIDWDKSPFFVVTEPKAWADPGRPRRANVSAFGFGGTNFHVCLEEATPQSLSWKPAPSSSAQAKAPLAVQPPVTAALGGEPFFVRGAAPQDVFAKLEALRARIPQGPLTRLAAECNAASRKDKGSLLLTVAAESGAKLAEKIDLVLKSREADLWGKPPAAFKPKSIHPARKSAKRPKIAFMFPGQGLQYVDMLKDMAAKYQVVADTFAEADEVMADRTGRLTEILWTKGGETPEKLAAMQERIKQTEVTQPVVLTADVALLRLLRAHGVEADLVYGHSLGEYGAHIAAGTMEFRDALIAVSMRAKEMAHLHADDGGKMASVSWPADKVQQVIKDIPGYIIAANKNCPIQTVLSGESPAIDEAIRRFGSLGAQAQQIEVSHAFHSRIINPAKEPYAAFLKKVVIKPPRIPILSNLTGDYFPEDVEKIKQNMVDHMCSPVEFITETMRAYEAGVRVFVELGPKRALSAFVQTTLEDKDDVHVFASNHPKRGGVQEFNDLLARLEAVGVEPDLAASDLSSPKSLHTPEYKAYALSGQLPAAAPAVTVQPAAAPAPAHADAWDFYTGPVVVSGIAAGTPGAWDKVFREDSLDCILRGQNFISKLEPNDLQKQIDKNIVRVVKSEDGNHRMEKIESAADVIKLAAVAGSFDLAKEFGFKESVAAAMDQSVRLAIAAGLLALKDAGIPLVRTYKRTTLGGLIPTGWALPESMRDETGIIYSAAFPNLNSITEEISRYLEHKYRNKPLKELQQLFDSLTARVRDPEERAALQRWYTENFASYMERYGQAGPYEFSRDYLLKTIPLGHSQLAQFIGARGPSTHVSCACASTTASVAMAEDWLRLGRAKRVLVIAGDDILAPRVREFMTSGFLAVGAATTKDVVSEAALPFDRRRHGLIIGMGAAGLVIEQGAKVAERGMRPLVEVLATQYENSAFHPTRLDVNHVADIMGRLVAKAERRFGLDRRKIAEKALFMSHETYTPARGGSASAEVEALKRTFGADAAKIVCTNTKGFHGHSMGASMEDPTAIHALVSGVLPPIANYREPDPELAGITLSQGGEYDLEYALRLAAGFGSQTAMSLCRRVLRKGESRIADPARHQAWLREISSQASPELEVVFNTLRVKELPGQSVKAAPAAPAPAYQPAPLPPQRPVPTGFRGTAPAPAPRPAPAPAVAVVEAPRPAAAAAGLSEDSVRAAIVALVGEKTGYPAEMLDPALDMEADLGIDTVKQAEIFGLIREKYGIPRKENLSLKDYPTLNHCVRFVLESTGGAPAPAVPAAAAPVQAASIPAAPLGAAGMAREEDVRRAIVALVGEKTGYPAEMLDPALDMEADLGIDTVKQAEIFGLIREKYGIPRKENLSLKDYPTLNHCVRFVLESTGGAPAAAAVSAPAPVQAPAPKPAPVQAASIPAAPLGAAGMAREEDVRRAIVALVGEKTGYPAEMLDPALDMEADLGIDTVKQAEIFGLIREKYGIPRKENLSLKDYPTLSHCVRFVLENTGGAPAPAAPAAVSAPAPVQAPAPKPAPVQAAAVPAPASGTDDSVRAEIVSLVSEKTGYPAEMLELDLDMEADLGIDTVKQAEIFGLIREKYGIPRQEGLSLKDYPTLRHVLGFVLKGKGGPAPAQAPKPAAAAPAQAPKPAQAPLTHNLRASVPVPVEEERRAAAKAQEQSRFNPWRLEVYLKQAKSFIPPMKKDRPAVVLVAEPKTAEPFLAAIEAAGGAAVVVKTDFVSPAEAAEELKKALKDKKAGGLLNLTALDLPPSFDDMTPNAYDKWYKRTARSLFLAAQALQKDLEEGWVLTLTKMGGTHGCRASAPFQPLSGALTGLTKAIAREMPKAAVRAVDFDAEALPSQMAELSLGELGSDDPRLEVGFVRGARHALRLLRHPRPEVLPRRVSQKSVFLITGGGGALATELAKDIASRFKCRLVLLDLPPLPKEASAWARMSEAELKAFKDSMWEELKKDPARKATPVMLEKEFGRVRFAIKVHRNVEELIRLGAKALYLSADLNDPAEVAKAAKAAMKEFGQIDYVIHTAGLEESKFLADKKVEQYDRVIRPKAHGAFHLLKAVPVTGAQRWAFFSSVVARFGNVAQADYATANDFLVKLASHMSAQKRSAVAFDLTAFADVGMAMKGSVTQFLQSMGVDFMPPKVGLTMLLDELVYGGGETEIVLTGSLGKLDADGLMSQQAPAQPGGRQLYDEVLTAEPGRFVLEKTFSLEGDAWLHDHSIEGIPYVAGVMGLELFAEAAAKLLGEPPKAFADVRYALPIKLLRGRPASVRVNAQKDGKGSALSIETEFVNAQGVKLGGPRTHFTSRIHEGGLDPWEGLKKPALPQAGQKFVAGQDAIYTLNFHGPSFQVLAGMYVLNPQELLALYRRPSKPLWARNPRTTVWDPLIVEAAFQTCGFRDLHFTKKLTLPDLAGVIERYDHGEPAPDELFIYAVYRGPAPMTDGTDRRLYDAVAFDSSLRVWLRLKEFRLIAQ